MGSAIHLYCSIILFTCIFVDSQAGAPLKIPPLGVVKVLGVGGSPSSASYNGTAISGFQFNTTNNVLLLTGINADLTSSFKITWE